MKKSSPKRSEHPVVSWIDLIPWASHHDAMASMKLPLEWSGFLGKSALMNVICCKSSVSTAKRSTKLTAALHITPTNVMCTARK